MRVAITGAGGYLGRRIVAAAMADPRVTGLTLTDLAPPPAPADPRVRALAGDIRDPDLQAAVWDGADAVIHLAAILSGAAEADPATSRQVNLDATLDLMARAGGRRFVLASTIAVYGTPPARTDDATEPEPTLIYGMHKRMAEIALESLTRRGALDGLALRIPGVVARRDVGPGQTSGFMSAIFHAAREGRRIVLPVAPEGRAWLASVPVVAAGLLAGALLPPGQAGARRSFMLPALAPRFGDLAAALRVAFGGAGGDWQPEWRPDPAIVAAFGSYGAVETAEARRLGFPADADLPALIAAALDAGPG